MFKVIDGHDMMFNVRIMLSFLNISTNTPQPQNVSIALEKPNKLELTLKNGQTKQMSFIFSFFLKM